MVHESHRLIAPANGFSAVSISLTRQTISAVEARLSRWRKSALMFGIIQKGKLAAD
jgi:hypothetical protein